MPICVSFEVPNQEGAENCKPQHWNRQRSASSAAEVPEPEGFGRVDVSLEGSVMWQPEAISAPKCQFTRDISL